MFKIDRIMCSKYANCFRVSWQCDLGGEGGGDMHDHFNEHANIFTLNMNKIFI